jgi:flagellar protein FliO/FliZ
LKTTPLIFGIWNLGLHSFRARSARTITSVTRWLLVVVGCAVLAMAQPMSAAPEAARAAETSPGKPAEQTATDPALAKPAAPDQIIYPRNSQDRPPAAPAVKSSSVGNMLILLVALALTAAGVWVLIQRRQAGPLAARGQRRLQIEETRPLGGRQYLVVANYDGKKYLLGITPGRINLLTPLHSVDTPAVPPEIKP